MQRVGHLSQAICYAETRMKALPLMVIVGSLTAFLKGCISRAGFTWNAHPLLLDAIMGGGEKAKDGDQREMTVKSPKRDKGGGGAQKEWRRCDWHSQRDDPESKMIGRVGKESKDEKQRWRREKVYGKGSGEGGAGGERREQNDGKETREEVEFDSGG